MIEPMRGALPLVAVETATTRTALKPNAANLLEV
jgi:hypothetical protein